MSNADGSIYADHLATLRERYDAALAATGYDAIIIGAGRDSLYFQDDQGPAFQPNPQLQQWFPATNHPGACLHYRPGDQPVAVVCQPEDYWHIPPDPPGAPWADHIDMRVVPKPDEIAGALPESAGKVALVGPENQWNGDGPAGEPNPQPLLDALHFTRAVKTPWEINHMRAATRSGVAGHRAAAEAFDAGATEFEILLAFLGASRQTAGELPYSAIVAGDQHAATLHYQHYRRDGAPAHSLLIDAGCGELGYASDITRTYAKPADAEFVALIAAMDRLQQTVCKRVTPGIPFARLHHAAHVLLGNLVEREDLINASPEEIVATGVTRLFFPHGLGHLLGLQVHDVGGRLADPQGNLIKAPDAYPKLRLLRTLEPGMTLTIEPGLYFIDSLLAELREHELAEQVNWDKIERLQPCGGIRIEDNLLVTERGSENLTRSAFDN